MTSNKRSTLKFQQKTSRPPLTREQCGYWLDHLPKILKIGTEFEINLPEPTAPLKKTDNAQCVHSSKPCVTDCVNLESCLVERHPTFCKTRESGEFLNTAFACPATDDNDCDSCKGCEGWSLSCRGLNCASHTPFCSVCPSFSRQGQTIESSDIRQDPESVRREMKELFMPSGFVGTVGKSGALEVIKDGSLPGGGIEVPTVGRRVHWQSFYNMCKGILDPIVHRGGFVNERCGQHFHVLAGYFKKDVRSRISELEQPLPEIVLANLHQLNRRYELAMFWMMSSGENIEHITRWARFRQSIYQYSALRNKMSQIQKELAANISCMGGTSQNGKYASVAYHFCDFDANGDVETFHIENRIADGCLSPAVISAWAMLCYAMVMKAVRLSQYGVMEVGDQDYVGQVKETMPHLIDGGQRGWGDNRHADTSGIGTSIPFLRESSIELVQLLKPELYNMGPAFNILMDLAEKPCSLRRCEGDSWDKIEDDLYGPYTKKEDQHDYASEEEVRELVDLAGIVECENINIWVEEVAANLGQDPQRVEGTVESLLSSGQCRWSEAIGSLITT
jgi:hypothetical protein